jgi:transcriptional regulator with XRE-family HTH domain
MKALSFAAVLKSYRETCRTSQSQLAIESGYDHSYVSRLESGQRAPTVDAVNRLAVALGLGPDARDHLMTSAGFLPRHARAVITDEPDLGDLLDLLHNDALPHAHRANVRSMLRLLADQLRMHQPVQIREAA